MSFDLGDVVPLEVIVTNAAGVNANAGSMALSITQPDGTAATITNPVAPAATGVYDYDFTPTQSGLHSVHWVATGANAGAFDDAFYVEAVSSKGILTFADLPVSLQGAELIHMMLAGANAKVVRVAPCLVDTATPPSAEQLNEARLVLVGAIKRWVEAGAGEIQSETVGPFSHTVDTRQRVGFNLWPSEINQLQDVCSSGTTTSSGAFSFTPSCSTGTHLPWCSINFGATYCSCGVDIAGYPIFELADGDYY